MSGEKEPLLIDLASDCESEDILLASSLAPGDKSIKTKYNPGHLRDKRWQNVILPWNRCHLSVTKSCPDLLQNREFLPSGWMCEIGRKKSLSKT